MDTGIIRVVLERVIDNLIWDEEEQLYRSDESLILALEPNGYNNLKQAIYELSIGQGDTL